MASFSAGTTFTDNVANDVTALKLEALVNAATPTSGLIQDRTAESTIAADDTLLFGDFSDSSNLKRMTVANFAGTLPTATITTLNSTTGTIATLNSTTGTIATLNSTTGTITGLSSTTGTIATLNSTTGTIPTLVATTLITTGTGTAAAPAIVPTGDANTGIFFPAADTVAFSEGGAEAMRIDSSGNVGIKNSTPSSYNAAAADLVIGSGSSNSGITISGSTNGLGSIHFADGTSGDTAYRGIIKYEHTTDNLQLFTSAAERLRIDSSGNVGINTGTVSAKLDVRTTGDGNFAARFLNSTTSDSPNGVQIVVGQNSTNAVVDVAQGTSYTSPTSLLRILGNGNIGIGTSSPSAKLELASDSAKKPSTNTWTIASDQRLKTNIINADNDRCYEIVKQVPLKRYTWKSEVYSQEKVKDRSKLGWIAQDVEAVFPKAVGTNRFAYNQVFEDVVTPELDSDGNAVLDENGVAKTKTDKRLVSEDVIEDCKNLNSDQIYAAMYGTIQKLIEKVEVLESKVATLEAA